MTSQEANTPPLPLIPITECPACHSKAWREIALGAAPLKRCKDCGLTYAPEYTDPDAIYLDGYFAGELGPFGVDTSHPDFRKFLAFVAQRRMDILERVVPTPGRIVDVGCGTGETLAEAKRRGWETYGVDLIADAVQVAIDDFGIDARQSLLEESGLPERSFDVVSATHVLEHMPDGAGFLTTLARWVKPGGHLFIEVPNWGSIDRMGNHERWLSYRPLEHLAHYSPKTLARTMTRVGFEPVATSTTCYQFELQTLPEAMHDLGLDRIAPRLCRRPLTKLDYTRGELRFFPNALTKAGLRAAQLATDVTKTGVVVIMVARVP